VKGSIGIESSKQFIAYKQYKPYKLFPQGAGMLTGRIAHPSLCPKNSLYRINNTNSINYFSQARSRRGDID